MAALIASGFVLVLGVGLIVLAAFAGGTRAEVEVNDGNVRVVPVGLSKMWAIRGSMSVPTGAIQSVETAENVGGLAIGWRAGGTALPGVVLAGNFRSRKNGRSWLIVGRGRPVVVITTDDLKVRRIVFSADDPHGTAKKIERAIQHR